MGRVGNQKVEGFGMVLPVASGAEISQLDIVAVNVSGYAEPASKKTGLTIAGLAQEYVNNSVDEEGGKSVLVKTGGYVLAQDGTISKTDILKPCYIVDKETVTKVADGSSKAGVIIGVDDECVTVFLQP